ncbi:hypothetical protein LLG95_17700 [bacterium]|nr:hypothetical protein [bacterium]
MCFEYRHFVIARPNYFRPTPQQLSDFILALGRDSWVSCPGSSSRNIQYKNGTNAHAKASGYYVKSKAGIAAGTFPPKESVLAASLREDAILRWPVPATGTAGLRYPLLPVPADDSQDWYWDMELHVGANYVYHSSECIDPFHEKVKCGCGTAVEFADDSKLFFDPRLYRKCPKCYTTVNVSTLKAEVHNGWTEDGSKIAGGGAYCTALVIDCGKCLPNTTDGRIELHPELRKLCENIFQCEFYELGDVY